MPETNEYVSYGYLRGTHHHSVPAVKVNPG
jgi:hypothetical protein